ncbi:MAG: ABC transporter permease [Dokdonella sp.]
MEALRRFAAIVLADLRERSRSTRFWVVLGLVGLLTWGCFPGIETGRFTVGFDSDQRAAYSSAWVGLVLGLMYSTMLSSIGFYLVRGTLVRDFDTRVWQLLVATPMTRAGYLLAKWTSHMAVLGLIMLVGLAIGAVAQWVRAEDHTFNLVELLKPVVVLALPSLAFSAFFAVLFDLLPWLRRTAGNVLFFFVWIFLFVAMGATIDPHKSAWAHATWISDPSGIVMVMRDFTTQLAHSAPWVKVNDINIGVSNPVATLHLFQWQQWPMHARDLAGRGLWVLLSVLGVIALAPALDWAAARTHGAAAGPRANPGRRLAWLNRVLRPLESTRIGMLLAAELKLVLRQRRAWWWLALLIAWGAQLSGNREAIGIGVIGAWLVSVDVFARAVLRERESGTGPLLFVAAGAARRLLVARIGVALVLAVLAVAPALLHPFAGNHVAAIALLLVAANVAFAGLALGIACRNPRPFELLLVVLAYAGVQGQGPLAVLSDPRGALLLHALVLPALIAIVVVLWPRFVR